MDDLLVGLVGFGVAVATGVLVIWTILALVVRAISFILPVVLGVTILALVIGIGRGMVLPVRVLKHAALSRLRDVTPDSIADGTAWSRQPSGPNKGYGWDWAWPRYFPYQAKSDLAAVVRQFSITTRLAGVTLRLAFAAENKTKATGWKLFIRIFYGSFAGIPYLGFVLGLYFSLFLWLFAFTAIMLVVTAGSWVVGLYLKSYDAKRRRQSHAAVICSHCHSETDLPLYQCPDCGEMHSDVNPGRFGLLTRSCGCGAVIPNTVSGAATELEAFCPRCRHPFAKGAGSRTAMFVPAIGTTDSGKTSYFSSALVGLNAHLESKNGGISPADAWAQEFLENAAFNLEAGRIARKTPNDEDNRKGRHYLMSADDLPGGVDLQIMDVAGEMFDSRADLANLRYLSFANAYVLVLNPFADTDLFRAFMSQLAPTGMRPPEPSPEQNQVWPTFSNALRSLSRDAFRGRRLYVVVSWADALSKLNETRHLYPLDSASIQSWLSTTELGSMVNSIRVDFPEARYYLVNCVDELPLDDPANPVHSFELMLAEAGVVPESFPFFKPIVSETINRGESR